MAFEEVEVVEGRSRRAETGVTARLTKIRSAKAKLWITVRRPTFSEWGFTPDDRFALLLGKGEDHGVIRLQKCAAGKVRAKETTFAGSSTFYSIYLHHRPEFVDRGVRAVPCDWKKIDEKTIEIVLPEWAKEMPLAPEKPLVKPSYGPGVTLAHKAQQDALERRKRLGM